MARVLLDDCVLLDPEARAPVAGALLLEDGRIAGRLGPGEPRPEDAERIGLGGAEVAPGLIDLHFHGRAVFAGDDVAAALARDAEELLRRGTTGFLTTTVALPAPELAVRVAALADAAAGLGRSNGTARPLGIHLEGPWINAAAAGAQPRGGVRDADPAELARLLGAAGGAVRMVTYAPELPGADALLEALLREGVVPALGHSLADADRTEAAAAAGARHVTHLFNAMGSVHQRAPGLAGAALGDARLSCDLICDGAHVDPRWVCLAARLKGSQLLLISDRIEPPPSSSDYGAGRLVADGDAWRLSDGRLAGSRLDLASALRKVERWGAMDRLGAVAACTLRPARLLGLEAECGSLRTGARADLAVLHPGGGVRETWLAGERVWCEAPA